MSVVIINAIKEHTSLDKLPTQYSFCLKTFWGLFLFFSRLNDSVFAKQHHSSGWRSLPVALASQHLTGKQLFHLPFVSHGITLAKHMIKQGEEIFFQSDKKLNSPCFIGNPWENARIISSTWIKESCGGEEINYQTTRVTIWNLLRIATTNAIMGCVIFFFFLTDGIKKENPWWKETVG